MLTGGLKREHIAACAAEGLGMAMPFNQNQKHEKDSHVTFAQECAEVVRALPHGDYQRGLAILRFLAKRYEEMDFSEYMPREEPPSRPPVRRIV